MRISYFILMIGLMLLSGCTRQEIGAIEFAQRSHTPPEDYYKLKIGTQFWIEEFNSIEFQNFVRSKYPTEVSAFILNSELKFINYWTARTIARRSEVSPSNDCSVIAEALNTFYRKRKFAEYDRAVAFLRKKAADSEDLSTREFVAERLRDLHSRDDISREIIATVLPTK